MLPVLDWLEFCKRYKRDLKNPETRRTIAATIAAARRTSAITLVYGANDTEHNEAVVLQGIFKRIARAESSVSTGHEGRRKVAKATE